jgi:hypothetical protein
MPISPLPILIDANTPEDADGVVNRVTESERRVSQRNTAVKVVRPEEITARVLSGKVFSPKDPDRPIYEALKTMQVASTEWDWPGFRKAYELARTCIPFSLGSGANIKRGGKARWVYAGLMNNGLRHVHPVLWFPYNFDSWSAAPGPEDEEEDDKQGRLAAPGLYCGDEKVAANLMLLLDYLRVCLHPKCMKLYVPKAVNQRCCCQRHSNSLRVKRCNDNKKKPAEAVRRKTARKSLR